MHGQATEPMACAYAYPLLVKRLLHTPLTCAPDQEIVYQRARIADASSTAFAQRTLLALRTGGNGPPTRKANESCRPVSAVGGPRVQTAAFLG